MSWKDHNHRMLWALIVFMPLLVLAVMLLTRRNLEKPHLRWPLQMAESPAYLSQTPNPVSRTGGTMRLPVVGTVARGTQPFHYGEGNNERLRAGRELTSPVQPTLENINRGKWIFETYCQICHGQSGAGDGPIIPKFPNPPDLRMPASKDLLDGEIFHIITIGQNKMPPSAVQVLPLDRWKAILYVRSLQGVLPAENETILKGRVR